MNTHSRRTAAAVLMATTLTIALSAQQQPQPPGGGRGRGRGSPPQPQQAQGLEYFEGTWTFSWTGRESPLTAGPRSGTTTFTRRSANVLDIRTEGTLEDAGGALRETGAAEWNEAAKTLRLTETLGNGAELTGTGDWSSPLSIRYESAPLTIAGETIRIRRTYSILSAHSFSVADEMSTDGGRWVRLGQGVYTKEAW